MCAVSLLRCFQTNDDELISAYQAQTGTFPCALEEIDMGVLRERMEREMVLRRMAFRTRRSYTEAVAALAKHYRRSPELLTEAEIQSYLLYLIEERKLARSSCMVALHGLRFFYHETLEARRSGFRRAAVTRRRRSCRRS